MIKIDLYLPNIWTVWYHKQDESSWDQESYIKVCDIRTIIDFVKFKNSFIYLPQFLNGYYFIMKNGISPMWEDAKNCDGGCINIKVDKDMVDKRLWDILSYAIIDQLVISNKENINGISIVPKRYNAIIKIWNNDKNLRNCKILNSAVHFFKDEDIYYRCHVDNEYFGHTQKK